LLTGTSEGQEIHRVAKRFRPAAWATAVDDPTVDPKFGKIGKQKIEDSNPLTRERMETIDGEVLGETLKWMDKVGKGDKPFFVWFNSTAIHIWSHPTPQVCPDGGGRRPRRDGCCPGEDDRTR
jgi:hypothetical protein